jgi:hypothetical protein
VVVKPSAAARFLRPVGPGLALVALAACGGPAPPASSPPKAPAPVSRAPDHGPPQDRQGCFDAAFSAAAAANAASLRRLPFNGFGRAEAGWAIYAPLVAREIGSPCPPDSSGFAAALARWQAGRGAGPADGVLTAPALTDMKTGWQLKRPYVAVRASGVCPEPPSADELETGRPGEGYGGKVVQLRPSAFAAYRAMTAAARAEDPEIAADPRNLTIFSAFRSPAYDAARCARQGNCNGVVRAVCSPHRTGLAMDLYVGQAPGYGPDSTADPNRLAQSRTAAYRWLVKNAGRFGFVNYPFEPWHWEFTGEAP